MWIRVRLRCEPWDPGWIYACYIIRQEHVGIRTSCISVCDIELDWTMSCHPYINIKFKDSASWQSKPITRMHYTPTATNAIDLLNSKCQSLQNRLNFKYFYLKYCTILLTNFSVIMNQLLTLSVIINIMIHFFLNQTEIRNYDVISY